MDNTQNSIVTKLGGWLGIVVTIVAIASSIFNLWLNKETERAKTEAVKAQNDLNNAKIAIEADLAKLEGSKEKTERLKFVQGLFDNVVAEQQNSRKSVLTLNLIRLTLSQEDAEALFRGLANSDDPNLRTKGETALKTIKKEKNTQQSEIEGFEYLRTGDFENALAAFTTAFNASPEYHNVDEIKRLLEVEKNSTGFSDAGAKKKVIGRILADYSWGMPATTKAAIKKAYEL